jgi:hypothetical protein
MVSNFKPIEDILLEDHTETRLVWQRYLDAISQEDKSKWYRQLVYLLAKHFIASEIVLYPLIRERLVNGNIMADLNLTHTRRLKQMLIDLRDFEITNPEFDNRLRAFWLEMNEHMNKIEQEDSKKLVLEIPLNDRIDAGRKFENRKMVAPTRPHVVLPDDSPTLETLLGLLMSPIDKFMDLFSKFPDQSELNSLKLQKDLPSNISGSTTTTTTTNIDRNI